MSASTEVTPLIPPMRWLLYIAAFLVFLAGLVLFVFPLRTADWFAWTVNPPMTAVFLGAAYWSAAGLEVTGARSASWDIARLAVWPVLVFTTLTLGVTLLHLDRFHLSSDAAPLAQVATWAWLAIYAVVPVATVRAHREGDRSMAGRSWVGGRPGPVERRPPHRPPRGPNLRCLRHSASACPAAVWRRPDMAERTGDRIRNRTTCHWSSRRMGTGTIPFAGSPGRNYVSVPPA
jgi:hypothetical protein